MPGTAVVTGGAKRIGRAITRTLADAGYGIAIHYRDSAQAAETAVTEIENSGGKAAAVQCDLSDTRSLTKFLNDCADLLGPVTCLVNNASLFECDSLSSLSEDSWNAHFSVNLQAPVFLARDMARRLPDSQDGVIINVLDQRVAAPTPDFFSYTLSKSALFSATTMLAQALAPRVRVNAVAPGPVLQSIHQSDQEFAQEAASTLLGHGATPEEIAQTVLFLVNARSTTGQVVMVDGGQHLSFGAPLPNAARS